MNHIELMMNKYCPNGVKYDTLGNLGKFYGGLTGKTKDDFVNGNAKFITYSNIYSNISLNLEIDDYVRVDESENQNSPQIGDVLFTGSSETREESGISSVVTNEPKEKMYLNSFCFGFRFNDNDLFLPEFTMFLFRSKSIRKQIIRTASGVTRFNVSKKKMENVIIPVPPIEIQREIVKELIEYNKAEKKLIEHIDFEIKRRVEVENLIYKKIVSEINSNKIYKLGDIVDFRNGKGHEKNIVTNGDYIVVNSKFISTNGEVKKYSDVQISPLYKEDILMVMSDLPNGKALAKCYIVEEDDKYTLNQRIGAFHIKKEFQNIISYKYLCEFLNRNKQLLKYDNKIDQTNLRKNDILNIDVEVPSISIQNSIVESINKTKINSNSLANLLLKEKEIREKLYGRIVDNYFKFKKEN